MNTDKTTLRHYRKQRARGWQAKSALHIARTLTAWDNLDGWHADPGDRWYDAEPYASVTTGGPVRLVLRPDDSCDPTDFDGTERQKAEVVERANRDGTWGLCGQWWDGTEWQEADSVWGFVGDDWRDSGYDSDIMRATLDVYEAHLESTARALEETRPDLYGAALDRLADDGAPTAAL